MRKKLLEDRTYEDELDRMAQLAKFPAVPVVRQEMIRTMRSITDSDGTFLHNLISFFVDHGKACPLPVELRERAGKMRYATQGPIGRVNCPHCQGTGFIHTVRRVGPRGVEPYDAEVSERCRCQSLPVGFTRVD